jgi:hypothetical protein
MIVGPGKVPLTRSTFLATPSSEAVVLTSSKYTYNDISKHSMANLPYESNLDSDSSIWDFFIIIGREVVISPACSVGS